MEHKSFTPENDFEKPFQKRDLDFEEKGASKIEESIDELKKRIKEAEAGRQSFERKREVQSFERKREVEKETEKEKMIKQEIREYIKTMQAVPHPSLPLSQRDEADEIAALEPTEQIEALIALVFEKGLKEAVDIVNKLNNPALLDAFHDGLVDCFYEELKKRKII